MTISPHYNSHMDRVLFDGQQSDERILYTVLPHPFTRTSSIVSVIFIAVFFTVVVVMIATAIPIGSLPILLIGITLSLIFTFTSLWYVTTSHSHDRTFLTDRRIIRFETMSPFFRTKRSLFWSEALKAKAYAPNMIYQAMNIGNLVVEPIMGEGESIRVTNIGYYEDLANYIDKILYIVKNNPPTITALKPFVPKPKGKRD